MQNENFDTDYFWRPLMSLLYLTVFLIIAIFTFLLFRKPITKHLNEPQYTAEQLEEFSRKRGIVRLSEQQNNYDLIENGIHVKTGLHDDQHLQLIISVCTSCHSAQLITQNKATREGWQQMIVWMQATQGLPDLGVDEPFILDYLAQHYAPKKIGRRANLDMEEIAWYMLSAE